MSHEPQQVSKALANILAQPLDKKSRSFFIPRSTGRRLAISDIHGCHESFCALLDKVSPTKDDQLFLLGDFVDRGPYSRLVVRQVKSLLKQGYQVVPLRGNHEQLLLDFNHSKRRKLHLFAERQNALHLLKERESLWPGMDRFFEALPYFVETDQHFLVHAGFDTRSRKPFKSWYHMLWSRSFEYDHEIFKGKTVVHGHVPVGLKRIRKDIEADKKVWSIDNGCVRAGYEGYGRLICVDLDSREIWKTKNRDTRRV